VHVSVVIPVYNDLERLLMCLEALDRQSLRRDSYEVIVVDNGSDDAQVPTELVSRFPFVKLYSESEPGAYAARNRGLLMAKGDLIAFTDADCVPEPDWLENAVGHFARNPNCAVLAGDIHVVRGTKRRAVEIYEEAVAFNPESLLEKQGYGVTANLFATREVFERVGHFDAGFKSGGDLEWGQRVKALGFEQLFGAKVLVKHPAMSSVAQLYGKSRRLAGGKYHLIVGVQERWFARQVAFLKMSLRDLVALPLALAFHLTLDRRVRGFENRLKYAGVAVWVRGVALSENVRLHLGKPAFRG